MRVALSFLLMAAVSLPMACDTATETGDTPSASAPNLTRFFFKPVLIQLGNTATLTGTADFTDSDGNLASMVLEFVAPGGSSEQLPVTLTGVAGQTSGTITLPEIELTPEVEGNYELRAWLVDADGQISNVRSDTIEVVITQTSACGLDSTSCATNEVCYDLTAEQCSYADEHNVTISGCADLTDTVTVVPQCVSSTESLEGPYAEHQCDFVQWWTNPTSLDADCRCGPNVIAIDQCKRPSALPNTVSYGAGPSMRTITNGFPDNGQGVAIGREAFVPMSWGDGILQNQGILFAINLDTGDRRHISGTYTDPQIGVQTVGAGEDFVAPKQVREGPDRNLYVIGGQNDQGEPKLYRVDKDTGDRTLIWDSETVDDALRCPNGNPGVGREDLQLHPGSFAMDEAGHFYLSGTPSSLPGPAIVKIDKDTYQCSYVSLVAANGNGLDSVGGGFSQVQFPFRGLEWNDGKLYAISNTQFHEIDPATGDRKLLTNAGSGGFGEGPVADQGLGNYYTVWDKHHQMFWTIGGSNIAVAVDPANGNRYSYPCWHPGLGLQGGVCNTTGRMVPGAMDNGGFIVDPDDGRYVYFLHDLVSVVKYDTQTSNAMILSL